MSKPIGLLASSVEGLEVARAIQNGLEYDAPVSIWTQDVFRPSSYPLSDLVAKLERSQFAVLLLTPDDALHIRDKSLAAPRDNLVFEAGLAIGVLGSNRTFLVHPREISQELRLPTDLDGFQPLTYDAELAKTELASALGPVCNKIIRAVSQLPPREFGAKAEPTISAKDAVFAAFYEIERRVSAAFGPYGRAQAVSLPFGRRTIARDGLTIARGTPVSMPAESVAVELLHSVAAKLVDNVGDFSKTAILTTTQLVRLGEEARARGTHPRDFADGMEAAAHEIATRLRSSAIRDNDRLKDVGATAANSHEIADIVMRAFAMAGKDGVISIDYQPAPGLRLESSEGIQIDRGYTSVEFVIDAASGSVSFDRPYVMLVDGKLLGLKDLLPLLDSVAQEHRALLIIAEDFGDDILETLLLNNRRGSLLSVAVKSPGFGDRKREILRDLAVLTNATVISVSRDNAARPTIKLLGSCGRVVCESDRTTLFDVSGDRAAIEERAKLLRSQINSATSDFDKEKLQERLAVLIGRIVTIRVGGHTEEDAAEDQVRVVRALHAIRTASDAGFTFGAGTSYLRARSIVQTLISKERDAGRIAGMRAVINALSVPVRAIARNVSENEGEIVSEVEQGVAEDIGFNASSRRTESLLAAGILDSAEALAQAIEVAASTAGRILTTENWEALVPEPTPKPA